MRLQVNAMLTRRGGALTVRAHTLGTNQACGDALFLLFILEPSRDATNILHIPRTHHCTISNPINVLVIPSLNGYSKCCATKLETAKATSEGLAETVVTARLQNILILRQAEILLDGGA